MPFILIQSGTVLQKMSAAGVLETLTLPTVPAITIDATKRPRWAIFNQKIILVNSPSQNLIIDPDGTVSPLNLTPPASAPVLAVGSAGDLTTSGAGWKVKVSFKVVDEFGVTLNESPLGPASQLSPALTADMLAMTGIPVSWQGVVNARGIYRTTDGGSVYFPWFDVDGNTLTAAEDDLLDAALQLVAAPSGLGLPQGALPGSSLTLIASWKERLWAVGTVDKDTLYYTDAGSNYTWKATNVLPVGPIGEDEFGITALLRRRDELGVAKRDRLCKIVGDRPANFQPITVVEQVGCVSQETVVVIRDTAYFLGEDGVYSWDSSGVKNLTQQRVQPWFTTDTYFNRARFPFAFARYNRQESTYELHLAAAGSSVENRWVSMDLATGRWLGPHTSSQMLPTCAGEIEDTNDISLTAIGSSDLFLYVGNQTTGLDHTTFIPIAWRSRPISAGTPNMEKVWLQAKIFSRIEGVTATFPTPNVQLTSFVGDINSATSLVQTLSTQTKSRNRTLRLSTAAAPSGRFVTLLFETLVTSGKFVLFGIEIPYVEIGER